MRVRASGYRLQLAAALLAMAACAAPLRNLQTAKAGADRCAQLAAWAESKSSDKPQLEGESSAQDDANEAAACFLRDKDQAGARRALLTAAMVEARATARPVSARLGGFDDAIARKVAAIALSAHAAGDTATFERASALLASLRGRELDLDRGDRRAVGSAGEAVSMIDGDCFFCARAEAYGAQNGEHVEQLGRWAGYSYVRRDDGREQFLVATRLIAEGQRPPQQLFAEAMRRRGRTIESATAEALAKRSAAPGEDASIDAPLFQLTLRGFAFGDVQRAEAEAGQPQEGLRLTLRSDSGELVVRFPALLLSRAQRDRRFVAPPDGVDAVVRFDGREGERPRYRVVILRHEDGVAEGP